MLFVGQAALQGDIARYAQHFNLLEVLAEPGRLPRTAKLSEWVERAGPEFRFSMRLSRRLWEANSADAEQFTRYFAEVARVLHPSVCVLQTPATATPTRRNQERLHALFDSLREHGAQLGWEPHGVWETEELGRWTEALGVLLVQDLSRVSQPLGDDCVYTRLRALGDAAHVKSGAVHQVAAHIASFPNAFVVMEGSGARGAARLLRELTEELAPEGAAE